MKIDNSASIDFNYEFPDHTEVGHSTSNTVSTSNMSKFVTKVKSSETNQVLEGEKVKQTIIVTNNSDVLLEEVNVLDFLTGGALLEPNSLKINGVENSGIITDGVILEDIAAGESVTLEYFIRGKSPVEETSVTNYANLSYKTTNPDETKTEFTEATNTINLDVVSTRIEIVKSVDKTFAATGDELVYTIVITNFSTARIKDIQFNDQLPQGTTFVNNSVVINGTTRQGVNPAHGTNLDPIEPGESCTISFKVSVN